MTTGHPLPLTGERTLPGLDVENYWFRRHQVAYLAAIAHVPGRTVLEAGCGEGYGADLLRREGASQVVAVDYDPPTLTHVAEAYPEVIAVRANLVALPAADASIDVVVSMQVLEHLWDQPRFLAECARVLRPGGRLVLSTPNRLTFSPGLGRRQKPANAYHAHEYDPEELAEALRRHLDVTQLGGVRHAPRLLDWEQAHGSLVAAQLVRPPEQWDDDLREMVAGITVTDFVFDNHDLDTCLDLYSVAERR